MKAYPLPEPPWLGAELNGGSVESVARAVSVASCGCLGFAESSSQYKLHLYCVCTFQRVCNFKLKVCVHF